MNDSPALSVFWGDERPPEPRVPSELSAEMTLVEFFHAYAWPDCLATKGDCEKTRRDYLRSLDYWARLTGNPPIGDITKRTCSQFLRQLRAVEFRGRPIADNTVYKHWVVIERLLEWTGPESRSVRHGADLVDRPPRIDGPRRVHEQPKPCYSLEDLWHWLQVLPQEARGFRKLERTDPADWWRALILTFYNTGMRPGTLFSIRWEMLRDHSLRVPREMVKGRRRGLLLYLNRAALDALQPIRRPAGLVFRWEGWPEAESTLRNHRDRLQDAAGIPRLDFTAFRRTFTTEAGKIGPIAMQLMTGHVGLGLRMAAEHYIDAGQVLADAMEKMPQPGPMRQKRLFD